MRGIDHRILVGFALLIALIAILSYLTLFSGAVGLSWSDLSFKGGQYDSVEARIFWQIRVPRLVAAVLSGISLAVAGLSLQTLFRNPLAGPFVLGISSGASLGVALSLLAGFTFGHFGVLSGAAAGALAVTSVVMFVASRFENSTILLIVGLLMGYFIDALVSLLIMGSDAESLRVYVSWGMGSFGRLTFDGIWIFALCTVVGLVLVALSIRYLNAARMGDDFAKGLGVNVRQGRVMVLLGASLLAAASTAFCGPVAFVGIAVPHLSFMLFKTSNHRVLMPASALCGVVLCLAASQFSKFPLNAVLSLVGVPVVLWVIVRGGGLRR
ncbi:ABC transporter permease [Fibrobacter sp. UWB1]|jgi:iron complex transport system permease protein|uniref:FecCD family ABC transporter permease n=1 Tax=unclassified Fibrobacter TaxID=2634177 RepID=UPI000910777E|nr:MULTISPECIES: iron ABC transporter permease [unclassified Fibrobacter]OWV26060.1 ABC transporter permease [Fibrobacter sp. UWB1]SHK45915.1 iron complex transport system permease protein [Fibrobacter sp. UWOV1]